VAGAGVVEAADGGARKIDVEELLAAARVAGQPLLHSPALVQVREVELADRVAFFCRLRHRRAR
jgi:hypothetical protein